MRVYLESEKAWTFACAVDHPGWQRRAKGEEAALQALEDYRSRYAAAVGHPVEGDLHVVGRVPGTATTSFGAPDARGPWDDEPLQDHEIPALQAVWGFFDDCVARASEVLQKGPRGGGRDRDEIVDHVREAERAYGRQVGLKVPPRTAWPEQRAALVAAFEAGEGGKWPVKYAVRRVAWHVLDHAWELEDKSL